MPTILRRLLLWTAVCMVSAAPSFVLASHEHDPAAMALAVCVFILAYTAATSTDAFEQFHRRPFVRRTLYIGYGTRMVISIVFPIAMFTDIFAGALSISVVRAVTGLDPKSFAGTFATTCVSGALLNLLIFAFMLAVYAIQRAFMRPPEEPRGFAVLLNAQPVVPAAATAVPTASTVVGTAKPDLAT